MSTTATTTNERPDQAAGSNALLVGAWFTHIYTAAGAVLALLALLATVENDIRAAFLWLAAATFVDSTDGLLARIFRVKDRLPHVDGARLDDIVDYLTFVFVPAFLLLRTGSLPAGWGVAVAFAILVSSAVAFVRSDAKTDDHFFTGFPSYWNIVAFYLIAARTGTGFNVALLMVLCVLVFVRIGYVYPSRTPTLRGPTLVLGYAWAALVAYLMWCYPAVNRALLLATLAYPAYYIVLSLALHWRRRAA
ncbi:MAG: CDP-alcohol phosphatidyltransferase family protein [Bacteroidales bacterium]